MDYRVSLFQGTNGTGSGKPPGAALGLRDMEDSQVTPGACLERGRLDVRQDAGGQMNRSGHQASVCQRVRVGDKCGECVSGGVWGMSVAQARLASSFEGSFETQMAPVWLQRVTAT